MSFKDKAREIREHGAEKRGTYSPESGSLPLNLYSRWAAIRPKKVRERENFCHYWRVVVFWAPVWIVLNAVGRRIDAGANRVEGFVSQRKESTLKVVLGAVVLGVLGGLTWGGAGAWLAALWTLVFLYLIASVFFGLYALIEYDLADIEQMREDDFVQALLVFFPSILVIALIKTPIVLARKVPEKAGEWAIRIGLGVFGLAIAALLVFLSINFPMYVLGVVGLLIVFAALVVSLSFLSDFLSLRLKKSREARTTVTFEDTGWGYEEEVKHVEPSKFVKFFIAIGDMINVAFQAVRVNKWKICPIVEIPKNESA